MAVPTLCGYYRSQIKSTFPFPLLKLVLPACYLKSYGELILLFHVFLAHQMQMTPAYPVRLYALVRVKHVYSKCLIQLVTSLVTWENEEELEKEKTRGKFVKPHNCLISLFRGIHSLLGTFSSIHYVNMYQTSSFRSNNQLSNHDTEMSNSLSMLGLAS